jgi:putative addiction module CopG family antidote
MPTRNISLTPEQDAFIEEAVKSGEYQNASEAVRDALRALQQRRREDALVRAERMARYRLSPPAEADLARILANSLREWGGAGRRRYSAILAAAIRMRKPAEAGSQRIFAFG